MNWLKRERERERGVVERGHRWWAGKARENSGPRASDGGAWDGEWVWLWLLLWLL